MNTSFRSAAALGLVTVLVELSSARAEDLRLASGQTLKNIEVTHVGTDHIVVMSTAGTRKIPLSELPEAVRQRYSAEHLFVELTRQKSEFVRVKAELAAANQELAALKKTQTPTGHKEGATPSPTSTITTAVSNRVVPRLDGLPELTPDEVVSAEDLAAQYRLDPVGADRRYRMKTFRVQGRIERFEERLFIRSSDIILDSGERFLRVACNLPYPEDCKAVYCRQDGQKLVGISAKGERPLLQVGEAVVFRGRCVGVRNSAIVFQNCESAR